LKYKKLFLKKKSVGIYSFHELINLESLHYVKKNIGSDLNDYIIDIKKILLQSQINLYEIRNLKNINFLDTIIFIDVANPDLILKKYNINCNKKILILKEPPVVEPKLWTKEVVIKYNYIFTYNKDFIKKFRNLSNIIFSLMPRNLDFNKFSFIKRNKKYCMFASNKISRGKGELYSERKKIINYFLKRKDHLFDLYGPNWNLNLFQIKNFVIKFYRLKKIRFWQGVTSKKLEAMSKYTFSFCYENIKNFNGYISEKIIDSMRAGCIPIYKGPKNIKDYIPENSFIDASKFYSIDKLILYLENITTSRIRKYQYNILKFLTTEAPKHFSLRNFSKKILHIVNL
jgi:hypothetical protein